VRFLAKAKKEEKEMASFDSIDCPGEFEISINNEN